MKWPRPDKPDNVLRLYRGLSKPYRPGDVGKNQPRMYGSDFTDCPYAALRFARGRYGVVLVVDVPAPEIHPCRVSEELWSIDDSGPRRFMVWRRFDSWLVAEIPGKELRAQIRGKGSLTINEAYMSDLADHLTGYIQAWIASATAGTRASTHA